MKPVKITENVYWVGGIDWRLRNFHGYLTQRGSTYNAYLILDSKTTLIDTVKHNFIDEMVERISCLIDPAKIDTIISNHVEMDHSGGIPGIHAIATEATVFASPKGVEGLKAHYGETLRLETVRTGQSLRIGDRSLSFVQTPMVHWPDNMVTYCPEEEILFSNDAFGQHIASSQRFDDEYPGAIVLEEARKYYANIVLPYGHQVQKVLQTASGMRIGTIAPSHGLIWRRDVARVVEEYGKWAANETDRRAVVIYDTMWGSTAKMAAAIAGAFEEEGIPADLICLQDTHISDVMTQLMTARYVCCGSPTLNNGMLPSMGAFLTYLRGLAPKNRKGLAFGSYGWGGQSVDMVNTVLGECGFDLWKPVRIRYLPSVEALAELSESTRARIREEQ